MTKRFHTTKDTGVIMGTHYKLYKNDEFICYVFDDRIYTLLNILNNQNQLIHDLKIDLRNALSSEGDAKEIRRCDEKYDLDYDNWWNGISDKLKERVTDD